MRLSPLLFVLLLCRVSQGGPDDWLEQKTLGFEIAKLPWEMRDVAMTDRGRMAEADPNRLDAELFDASTVVAFVYPGIPLSGIVPGTLIVSLNETRIQSRRDWDKALTSLNVGSEARVSFRQVVRKKSGPTQSVQLRVLTGREAARAAVRLDTDSVTGRRIARFGQPTDLANDSDAPVRLQFSIDDEDRVTPYLQLPNGWQGSLEGLVLSEYGQDLLGDFKYQVQIAPRLPDQSAGLCDDRLVCVDEVTLNLLGRSVRFAVPPPSSLTRAQWWTTRVDLRVMDARRAPGQRIQPTEAAAFRAVLRAYQAYGGVLRTVPAGSPSPGTLSRSLPVFRDRDDEFEGPAPRPRERPKL